MALPAARRELRQHLKERHIAWIAFGATVGFGLTIRSGQILSLCGPLGAVIAYILVAFMAWTWMGPLVEMSSVIPVGNGVYELPGMFLDKRLGTVLGWLILWTYVIVFAEEIAVTGRLIAFQYKHDNTPVEELDWGGAKELSGLWAFLAMVLSLAVNALPVKYYGEFEYFCGVAKMIGLVVIIVAQIPVNKTLGLGTLLWDSTATLSQINDNPLISNATHAETHQAIKTVLRIGKHIDYRGSAAQFLEIWSALTYMIFSLIGIASIPVAARESVSSGRDLKDANRKTLLRVLSISIIGIIVVSFNTPHDHSNLLRFGSASPLNSGTSPFMIAFAEAKYYRIANFANALFVFFTFTCGASNLFISSRTLYFLASDGHMPDLGLLRAKLATTTTKGVPFNALFLVWSFGFLGFLGIGDHKSARKALEAMSKIGSTCWLIVFFWICTSFGAYYTYLQNRQRDPGLQSPEMQARVNREYEPEPDIQMQRQIEAQPVSDPIVVPAFPYKTRFQPARSIFGAIVAFPLLVFVGWYESGKDCVPYYIAHVVFFVGWGGLKAVDVYNDGIGVLKPLFSVDGAAYPVDTWRTGNVELPARQMERGMGQTILDGLKSIAWWFV